MTDETRDSAYSDQRGQSSRPPRENRLTNEPLPGREDRRPNEPSARRGEGTDLPRLGSLAQEARNKHLKQARTTLLVVGILIIIAHIAMYFIEMNQLPAEIQKVNPGATPAQIKQMEALAQPILLLIYGGVIAVGGAFILLSFFVLKYPVPITATALALFIGLQVVAALIDPKNLASGWLIKIIVIVALVKALQAGIASQKEARAADPEFAD
jgi:hypothetical protein